MPAILKRAILAILLLAALSIPSVAADATSAWNAYAATYSFDTGPVAGQPTATFLSMYNGSQANFDRDFYRIWGAIETTMGPKLPPPEPDSAVWSTTITNW